MTLLFILLTNDFFGNAAVCEQVTNYGYLMTKIGSVSNGD
ncbi:uncharacterized protein METZ01_LOCUS364102 [marine metagenome]|uniref:Uncharacterized protein n=1 Tax=marine metagenome TaxID=408172 RepID=A0A382SQ11_9ZZZZ